MLKGVKSVTMNAVPDAMWEATIVCDVDPPALSCIARIVYQPRLTWWRRILLRFAGVSEVETTSIHSSEREYKSLKSRRAAPHA